MMQLLTIAQLRDAAERCHRLARGIGDPLTTTLLAALAEIYATEADVQVASETREQRRAHRAARASGACIAPQRQRREPRIHRAMTNISRCREASQSSDRNRKF
jgi:hypothetical protein